MLHLLLRRPHRYMAQPFTKLRLIIPRRFHDRDQPTLMSSSVSGATPAHALSSLGTCTHTEEPYLQQMQLLILQLVFCWIMLCREWTSREWKLAKCYFHVRLSRFLRFAVIMDSGVALFQTCKDCSIETK